MNVLKFGLIVLVLGLLSGCSTWFKKSEDKNPLVVTECPAELPPLLDPSMGAQGKLMIEWAGIYQACRLSCRAGVVKP